MKLQIYISLFHSHEKLSYLLNCSPLGCLVCSMVRSCIAWYWHWVRSWSNHGSGSGNLEVIQVRIKNFLFGVISVITQIMCGCILNFQDLTSNSPYCLPYNSYDVSLPEFDIGSNDNPYSHHLPVWYCFDMVRRNSVLITYGTYGSKRVHTYLHIP